ncbi:Bifunctional transcriptional activator/DNA repair enzyme AdaA [compost metagenome]
MKRRQEEHKDKLNLLFDRVAAGDMEKIDVYVKEFLASYGGNLPDIELIKAYVANLELMICQLISEMNGDPDTLMKGLQLEHGTLGSMADYSLIERYVHQLCVQTAARLCELKQENECNTIFHVIQYVDREFQRRLQLQELARQFHMNSAYLGQLFKKNTGKSFNAYLNEKRIEEAKRLLKRTQMKISDVAIQVGYPNTDYFINKFKMQTGVLPSAYKHDIGNK